MLKYEETFKKEKVIFENTKVISFTLLSIFFSKLQVCLFFFWWLKVIEFHVGEKDHHPLEEILSFVTKKSMIKCPKRVVIECNNRILLQILCVKSYNHILVMHLTSRWLHGSKKVDVVFLLQVFIHMTSTIND